MSFKIEIYYSKCCLDKAFWIVPKIVSVFMVLNSSAHGPLLHHLWIIYVLNNFEIKIYKYFSN